MSEKKFGLFEGGKPCSTKGFPQIKPGNGWDNHLFDTFDRAEKYAREWLGPVWEEAIGEGMQLGKPVKYNGFDEIIIKEVEDEQR